MTREEKAKAYADMICAEYPYEIPTLHSEVRRAYLQGSRDANDNPTWRMCKDELPHPNEDVLVAFDNGDRGIGYYEGIGDWYVNGIGVVDNIIAWLPLPKFNPKKA